MTERKKYAILQFVEQKGYCHIVHDNVCGKTLMEYAKGQNKLNKSEAIKMAINLVEQMELFYRCEDQKPYGYLNPYAIVISEDGKVLLLDVWAEENKPQVTKMKNKKVRVLFISPEYVLSQKKRPEDDWFGCGKTIQFLIEKCCEEIRWGFQEQHLLMKLYTFCLSGEKACIDKWKKLKAILLKLGKAGEVKKRIALGRPVFLLACAMFFTGIFIGMQLIPKTEPIVVEKTIEVPVENDSCEIMMKLIQKEKLSEKEKGELNKILEEKETTRKGTDWLYRKCIAEAYEKIERYEIAAVEYESILKMIDERNELKNIYVRLIRLYDFMDLPETVKEKYVEAVELFPELKEEIDVLETEREYKS